MKKAKQTKWQKIIELQEILEKQDNYLAELDGVDHKDFHSISQAPNIGINGWIFYYKGVLVALWDDGNGYYSYFTAVSRFTLIKAQIISIIDTLRWKFKKGE